MSLASPNAREGKLGEGTDLPVAEKMEWICSCTDVGAMAQFLCPPALLIEIPAAVVEG